jgi:hypothetical protein
MNWRMAGRCFGCSAKGIRSTKLHKDVSCGSCSLVDRLRFVNPKSGKREFDLASADVALNNRAR